MQNHQSAAGSRRQGSSVLFLAQAAVIAALYTVLTLVAVAMNLAFGPVQFRFSEALTILPVFTPAAIPGLLWGVSFPIYGAPLAWRTLFSAHWLLFWRPCAAIGSAVCSFWVYRGFPFWLRWYSML